MGEDTITIFTLPFSTTLDEGLLAVNAAGEIIFGAAEFENDEPEQPNNTAQLGKAKLGIMKLGR